MKIYILTHVYYDYHEFKSVVDVDTDIRELLKRTPNDDDKLFTMEQHDNENDVEHFVIETWEGGVKLT